MLNASRRHYSLTDLPRGNAVVFAAQAGVGHDTSGAKGRCNSQKAAGPRNNMGGGSTMIHSRRLWEATTVAALGWVLTTARPIAAKTITYTPQQVYYTYCFSHPPAARIASGDTVVTKTRDASNDLIQATDKTTGKL